MMSQTKQRIRVMAVGDSLALPGHGNTYEDTWLYKLKLAYPEYDFITQFVRALTTEILVTSSVAQDEGIPRGADCLEYYRPEFVILQLGIVDCAPRLFKKDGMEKSIASYLPSWLKQLYIKFIKKTRKRGQHRAYVPHEEFISNLENYFERCKAMAVQKCIVLKIANPDDRMVKANPEILVAINTYNDVYDSLAKLYPFIVLLDPLNSNNYAEEIFDDGYHPNPKGHDLVSHALQSELKFKRQT